MRLWRGPRRRWTAAVLAAAAAAQLACAGHCDEERRITLRRIEAARAKHADAYAGKTFQKSVDLAEEADAECRSQAERFFLLRSYSRVRNLNKQARSEADQALRETRVNEGMARQEALNARYRAIESVEDARDALLRVRKAKGDASALDLVDLMDRLRRALSEMQRRIDQGEYLSARDLGNRIIQESIRLQATANRRTLGLPPPPGGMDQLY